MKKFIALACLIILFSCQKKSEETTTEAPATPSFENERRAFFNSLSSPGDAAAGLQATGADFNASLLNDPKKFATYTSSETKAAANLGVYLADLNYAIAYKESDHVKAIFPAAHALSKSVGIEQGILDFLMKRYNDNLAKNDSVKAVVDELFASATKDVEGSSREKMIGIAMSAFQIENLHIAMGIISSYPKDMLPTDARTQILVPVFRHVFDQKNRVEIIYGFLKSISDPANPEQNPNYTYYAKAFEDLIETYKKLNIDEKIANNKGTELMTDAVVAELSSKVDAIRSKIVSAE
ncbi:MAG TPA: hypothetical protein VK589_12595 [Chryseolinea sp.]|nr:hypothetical protein [Chryseolinea sp.]